MEQTKTSDLVSAGLGALHEAPAALNVGGKYVVECHEYEGGPLVWRDDIDNVITIAGRNKMYDNYLAGSSFSQVGPFMGLISATAGTPVEADTMSSHGTWTECGNAVAPAYNVGGSQTRPTLNGKFDAASGGNKAVNSGNRPVFTISSNGTVRGAFLVCDTSASNAIDNTSGTLFSAGLFSGGNQPVIIGNTLTVSWQATSTSS
jgi:hypothetical protein